MKISIIFTFLLLLCCVFYSQSIHDNKFINKTETIVLKESDSDNTGADKNRISIGAGVGGKNSSALISINFNFRIYNPLFIEIGSDVVMPHNLPAGGGPYIAPNFKIDISNKRLSIFGGIGVQAFMFQEGIVGGILFLEKTEYNINQYFSAGFGIKFLIGAENINTEHLYFSYKF